MTPSQTRVLHVLPHVRQIGNGIVDVTVDLAIAQAEAGLPVAVAATAVNAALGRLDLLLGIGGTPEGIIAACALKCMGGALQGKLWPKDDEERQKALDAGHDLDRVLHIDDLVRGDVFFVATGITDGELLRGVQYRAGGCTTQSLVMRSRSGTIRSIESLHSLEKLRAYSAVPFDN